jgi:hypothetical protein
MSRKEKARHEAGIALQKFRRHTTGSGQLELGRPGFLSPVSRKLNGTGCIRHVGLCVRVLPETIVVLSSIVSRQCLMTTESAYSIALFAPGCARFNDCSRMSSLEQIRRATRLETQKKANGAKSIGVLGLCGWYDGALARHPMSLASHPHSAVHTRLIL